MKEKGVLKMAFLISNSFINMAGIVANSIVIAVYQRNKQLKTKSNVIIATIGVVSIFLALSELAASLSHILGSKQYPNDSWLNIQKCIEVVFGYYTVHAMALMSILRRNIISHIRRPNIQTNLFKIKMALLVMITCIAGVSIPLIVTFDTTWLDVTFYLRCNVIEQNSVLFYSRIIHIFLVSFIPSCIVVVSYSYIQNHIRSKSRTLYKKPGRQSLKRSSVRRPDRQSRLSIITILVFFILFYIPREVMTLLLITKKQFISNEWLYFTVILMSNVFQQFTSLMHACTSTRYRLNLRKSFKRVELSIQTRDSATSSKRQSKNRNSKRKVMHTNNQRSNRTLSNTPTVARAKRFENINTLHSTIDQHINDSSRDGSLSVRYVVENKILISGLKTSSGKTVDFELKEVKIQCQKPKVNFSKSNSGRRFTDSELVIKSKLNLHLQNVSSGDAYHMHSSSFTMNGGSI